MAGGLGQGYRFTLYFDSDPFDFENCRVRMTADEVDTTGSLVVDETGTVVGLNGDNFNGPFTDAAGGPKTCFIEFSGVLRNLEIISYLALFRPGDKIPGQAWTVYYDGRLWITGNGILIQDVDIGAVVRGAATVSFRMRSTQNGFGTNDALAS